MSISIGMLEHHDNADKKDCIGWSALQHANRMRRIMLLLVVADASLATLLLALVADAAESHHYQLNSDFRDR